MTIQQGTRDTSAAKRRRVALALQDPEMTTWSSRRLADHCGVSHETVRALRSSKSDNPPPSGDVTAPDRPARGPTDSPTPLDLARAFDEACARHAEAEAASGIASAAHDSALAAQRSALNGVQEAQRLAMHGRDAGEVAAARAALREAVAEVVHLEAVHRETVTRAAAALADRTAAGAALAQAMDARGLEFARWGDRLIVDRSTHPAPDLGRYPIGYRMGGLEVVRQVPPSVWAVELVELKDLASL